MESNSIWRARTTFYKNAMNMGEAILFCLSPSRDLASLGIIQGRRKGYRIWGSTCSYVEVCDFEATPKIAPFMRLKPYLEPLWLEGTLRYRGLSELPLREA